MTKKFLLFGIIGVVNTLVDWSAFTVLGLFLPHQDAWVWTAKAASYTLGVLSSFVLNSRLTFKAEYAAMGLSGLRDHLGLFARFGAVAGLCLVLNSSTYTWLSGGRFLQLVPLIVATAVSYVVGFLLNHFWTYRQGGNATISG